MTADTLKSYTTKDLAEMAKTRGVRGWHAMRKDQLIKALLRMAQAKRQQKEAAKSKNGVVRKSVSSANGTAKKVPASAKTSVVNRRVEQIRVKQERVKNLATRPKAGGKLPQRDRLVVLVRDAYWLHACWELTRQGIERAQAALAQDWHTARPVLRMYQVVNSGATSGAEKAIRDIEIHGGVNNWYIDLQDAPRTYRLDIGYRAASGRFYTLARSNTVTPPKADSKDAIDNNWTDIAEDYDRIYALSGGYNVEGNSLELQELFEERLRRPMGSPLTTGFGAGAEALLPRNREFYFEIDAELIVFGKTEANAHVTLQGEPVRIREDGTFTVRFSMPNARQVIPAVASSSNGLEQRTVVLAIERNTKVMEPLVRDSAND